MVLSAAVMPPLQDSLWNFIQCGYSTGQLWVILSENVTDRMVEMI